jgi:hypothetical protein
LSPVIVSPAGCLWLFSLWLSQCRLRLFEGRPQNVIKDAACQLCRKIGFAVEWVGQISVVLVIIILADEDRKRRVKK